MSNADPSPIPVSFVGEGVPLEFQGWPSGDEPPFPGTAQNLALAFKNTNPSTVRIASGQLVVTSAQGHLAYVTKDEIASTVDIPAGEIRTVVMALDFDPIPSGVVISGTLRFVTELI